MSSQEEHRLGGKFVVLRITFFLRNPGYFRNIEWIINSLVRDYSCDVRVVIDGVENSYKVKKTLTGKVHKHKSRAKSRKEALADLRFRYPQILFSTHYPGLSLNLVSKVKKSILDNLFFSQDIIKGNSPAKLRLSLQISRIQRFLIDTIKPSSIQNLIRLGEYSLYNSILESSALTNMKREVRELDTDLICIIPCVGDEKALLLGLASKELGIPTVGLIASWDNLTIKGKFFDVFTKTICWSDAQITEYSQLHGYSEKVDSIFATGSYPFAHRVSLNRSPKAKQEDTINLTWFMSSGFISKAIEESQRNESELDLVGEFLDFLSTVPTDTLKKLNITFKLHPQNAQDERYLEFFRNRETSSALNFSLDNSGEPIGDQRRKDYDTLLLETDVCVGLATTALFEAALLGKPTIAPPGHLSLRSFSELTHGSYLAARNGGPVSEAKSWSDFLNKILSIGSFEPSGNFIKWTTPTLGRETIRNTVLEILSTDVTNVAEQSKLELKKKYSLNWITLVSAWLAIELGHKSLSIPIKLARFVRFRSAIAKRKFVKRARRTTLHRSYRIIRKSARRMLHFMLKKFLKLPGRH